MLNSMKTTKSESESDLLYRGENVAMFARNGGRLIQKCQGPLETSLDRVGRTVELPATRGGGSMPWNRSGQGPGAGVTRGPSLTNTVLEHEAFQRSTPGVSTTPHLDRAIFYATWGGVMGKVHVIDRGKLARHEVKELVVAQHVPYPRVPEDEEVLLVFEAADELPAELVIGVLDV